MIRIGEHEGPPGLCVRGEWSPLHVRLRVCLRHVRVCGGAQRVVDKEDGKRGPLVVSCNGGRMWRASSSVALNESVAYATPPVREMSR